jgi:hypothetical protein
MKNILGHDDDSEILTVISRMRENKFSVLSFNKDSITFEIILTIINSVPISSTYYQKIQYIIEQKDYLNKYKYVFKQINGKETREINMIDGYIIWSLLVEKI